MTAKASFSIGDLVADSKSDTEGEAVVYKLPDANISDWEINEDGVTVSDANPFYSDTESVVLVLFESQIEALDVTRFESAEDFQLAAELNSLEPYAYPESRLDSLKENILEK